MFVDFWSAVSVDFWEINIVIVRIALFRSKFTVLIQDLLSHNRVFFLLLEILRFVTTQDNEWTNKWRKYVDLLVTTTTLSSWVLLMLVVLAFISFQLLETEYYALWSRSIKFALLDRNEIGLIDGTWRKDAFTRNLWGQCNCSFLIYEFSI